MLRDTLANHKKGVDKVKSITCNNFDQTYVFENINIYFHKSYISQHLWPNLYILNKMVTIIVYEAD